MRRGIRDMTHNYAEAGLENIPVRQGDLLEAGSTCLDSRSRSWYGCVVVHPSCDIVTRKVEHIQVCRVRRLREQSSKYQKMIVAGQSIDDQGRARVAMVHTFFLPPVKDDGPFSEPMFADFLHAARVPIEEIGTERRVAALTHDARNCFIRRSLYWRQRWLLTMANVQELERRRISADPDFLGPRPPWAPLVVS